VVEVVVDNDLFIAVAVTMVTNSSAVDSDRLRSIGPGRVMDFCNSWMHVLFVVVLALIHSFSSRLFSFGLSKKQNAAMFYRVC
jgi:hypothetical protein